jgi:hypothetical protein
MLGEPEFAAAALAAVVRERWDGIISFYERPPGADREIVRFGHENTPRISV